MKNPRPREGDGLARSHQLLNPLGPLTETPGLVCFLAIGSGVTGPCIEHLLRTYCICQYQVIQSEDRLDLTLEDELMV